MDIDNCIFLYRVVDILKENINLVTIAIVVSRVNCRHFYRKGLPQRPS